MASTDGAVESCDLAATAVISSNLPEDGSLPIRAPMDGLLLYLKLLAESLFGALASTGLHELDAQWHPQRGVPDAAKLGELIEAGRRVLS